MDVRRRGVIWFLVLSFGGTWPVWFIAYFGFGLSMADPVVQLPTAFVPAIAAIVVRRWVTREGFADAGLRPRVRALWRWYLLAWIGPVGITVAALALALGLGLWDFDPAVAALPMLFLMSLLLVWAYWGEEFGWTSYLRARVFPGRPVAAGWFTGLVWAAWHWPLPFLGYTHFERPWVTFPLWTLSFVLQQTALWWLYKRSGSVWVASLAHAGNNMVIGLASGEWLAEAGGLGEVTVILLTSAPLAAACAFVWWRGRRTADAERTGRRSPAETSRV